jgi:molybdopterin-guanine dinucleotide biosynthesis protein A
MSGPERIVMARSQGNAHPVVGLWPVALREDLARWLVTSETMKVQAWAARHEIAYCDFEPEHDRAPDPFFNANTPEDLAEAAAIIASSEARHPSLD